MCIRRINWICQLIKKIQWQNLVWSPRYSTPHFPNHPLPLSQGLDECPTLPHLCSSSGSLNGISRSINLVPMVSVFFFALEREQFWHFSYFYLFFNSLLLTDYFLLLVFSFFLTHCINLTLCLSLPWKQKLHHLI